MKHVQVIGGGVVLWLGWREKDSQVELVMSYHFGLMNWEVNRVR